GLADAAFAANKREDRKTGRMKTGRTSPSSLPVFHASCLPSVLFSFEGRLDAGHFHVLRRDDAGLAAALARLDLADARQDVGLELVELLLAHLAELHAHLRVEQPLAQHGVVVQLG